MAPPRVHPHAPPARRYHPCDRCHFTMPLKILLVGIHETGEVLSVCPPCCDMLEHTQKGRRLPDHPIFYQAADLLRRAAYVVHVYQQGVKSGAMPEAMERLKRVVNYCRVHEGLAPVANKNRTTGFMEVPLPPDLAELVVPPEAPAPAVEASPESAPEMAPTASPSEAPQPCPE